MSNAFDNVISVVFFNSVETFRSGSDVFKPAPSGVLSNTTDLFKRPFAKVFSDEPFSIFSKSERFILRESPYYPPSIKKKLPFLKVTPFGTERLCSWFSGGASNC